MRVSAVIHIHLSILPRPPCSFGVKNLSLNSLDLGSKGFPSCLDRCLDWGWGTEAAGLASPPELAWDRNLAFVFLHVLENLGLRFQLSPQFGFRGADGQTASLSRSYCLCLGMAGCPQTELSSQSLKAQPSLPWTLLRRGGDTAPWIVSETCGPDEFLP